MHHRRAESASVRLPKIGTPAPAAALASGFAVGFLLRSGQTAQARLALEEAEKRIRPPTKLRIAVKQGERGKWRWQFERHGATLYLSPVRGWATAKEAMAAAEDALDHAELHFVTFPRDEAK